MKRSIYLFLALIGISACYDDTKVWEELQKHNERISQLEAFCDELNTNVNSLQTIVKALEERDYVTGVSPIVEDGVETGYTISFAKNEAITIFHGKNGKDGIDGENGKDGVNGSDGTDGENGKDGTDGENGKDGVDGKDGHTPMIGVKKDSDGIYYWTLDGEWLLDDTGDRLKATGTDGAPGEDGKDGADGVTPQLTIIEGYWYISYENGAEGSWKQLGEATGVDGKDGKSFFNSVTDTKDAVELELADGTRISLPKLSAFGISFDIDEDIKFSLGQTYRVGYTLSGTDEDASVSVITSDGLKAEVIPSDTDQSMGDIFITTPMKYIERSTVVVMVSDGYGRMYMKALNFVYEGSMDMESPIFVVTSAESLNIPAEGGSFEIPIQTNLNYMVEIGEGSTGWLSSIQTKALREGSISFTADANTGGRRYGFLYVCDMADRGMIQTICIRQEAGNETDDEFVEFADSLFAKYMIDHYDLDLDGMLSYDEAEKVTSLNIKSKGFTDLTGIGHLVNLEALDCSYNNMTSLDLRGNAKLRYLNCKSMSSLDTLNISGNAELSSLDCSHTKIRVLDLSATTSIVTLNSASCGSLTEIRNIETCGNLRHLDVQNCKLSKLNLSGCTELGTLYCQVNNIESLNLKYCLKLQQIDVAANPLSYINLGTNPYITYLRLSDVPTLKVAGENIIDIFCGNSGATVPIENIDISECPNLEILRIYNFQGDIDISDCKKLKSLCIYQGAINNLKLNGADRLERLDLTGYDNSGIIINNWEVIDLPELKYFRLDAKICPLELDLSRCKSLEELKIIGRYGNNLKSIKLANLSHLKSLYISCDSVTDLEIKDLPALSTLYAYVNSISDIDLTSSKDLKEVTISTTTDNIEGLDLRENTQLTKIDISNIGLQWLYLPASSTLTNVNCANNNITNLDISMTPGISYLYCAKNPLETLTMKSGHEISSSSIPDETEIIYID